jgi:hypothetical protein
MFQIRLVIRVTNGKDWRGFRVGSPLAIYVFHFPWIGKHLTRHGAQPHFSSSA